MKSWNTIIAVAAAVAAIQAQAETLEVQYTKQNGTSHTLLVEGDIEYLDFGNNQLTSFYLAGRFVEFEKTQSGQQQADESDIA